MKGVYGIVQSRGVHHFMNGIYDCASTWKNARILLIRPRSDAAAKQQDLYSNNRSSRTQPVTIHHHSKLPPNLRY